MAMEAPSLEEHVRHVMAFALQEDCAHEDLTTQACIDDTGHVRAELLLKERAHVAGLVFLPWALDIVGISSIHVQAQEGAIYDAGTVLASFEGSASSILSVERCLLNLIQHASGIAHIAAQFVEKIQGIPCAILDTRKTLPGLRAIQKYAVRIGGGNNHRFNLKECILIKNNHLKIMSQSIGNPIKTAIDRARKQFPGVPIEVEVHSLDQLQEAFDAAPDAILLDNMTPECVRHAVHQNRLKMKRDLNNNNCVETTSMRPTHFPHCFDIERIGPHAIYLEASGGITLSNVRAYAETGVDAISIGALTHSARAIDISLRM